MAAWPRGCSLVWLLIACGRRVAWQFKGEKCKLEKAIALKDYAPRKRACYASLPRYATTRHYAPVLLAHTTRRVTRRNAHSTLHAALHTLMQEPAVLHDVMLCYVRMYACSAVRECYTVLVCQRKLYAT